MVPAYAETRDVLREAAREARLSQAAWLERAVRVQAQHERSDRRDRETCFIPFDEYERVRRGMPRDLDEAIRRFGVPD
jgi:hypothetical protein